MFDRNVLWSLKKYPELQTEKGQAYYEQRLKKVFDATIVSNHLLMFHVYFLKHIARPDGVTIQQIRGMLDFRCGRPTYQMKDQLMEECKIIQKVEDWPTFFQKIHVSVPSNDTLAKWLERCVTNSLKKGYHHPSWLKREAKAEGHHREPKAEGHHREPRFLEKEKEESEDNSWYERFMMKKILKT